MMAAGVVVRPCVLEVKQPNLHENSALEIMGYRNTRYSSLHDYGFNFLLFCYLLVFNILVIDMEFTAIPHFDW